jgi:hypothetical protein
MAERVCRSAYVPRLFAYRLTERNFGCIYPPRLERGVYVETGKGAAVMIVGWYPIRVAVASIYRKYEGWSVKYILESKWHEKLCIRYFLCMGHVGFTSSQQKKGSRKKPYERTTKEKI